MKRILITGVNSYIGVQVEKWLKQYGSRYKVDKISLRDDRWMQMSFQPYDVVFHVAGIAHADTSNVSDETKALYYQVNTDLTINVALKARRDGVKQFIFMSSMIVYGGCSEKVITRDTVPCPANFYGDSKWQADKTLQGMDSKHFHVVILRPPMIYGKGSKGNYPRLSKIASTLPVYPRMHNKRSILYIENLCEFVRLMIENDEHGVFFPQNAEHASIRDIVKMIARIKNHRIWLVPYAGRFILFLMKTPGKIGVLTEKAFGTSAYDLSLSEYRSNYRVCSLEESIRRTEE